jgi:hypothetical protein
MEESLESIYASVPPDPPRSRLEPYRELILRWRRQGRTYRRICQLLHDNCDLKISYLALYEFVQSRSRPRKSEPEPEPITTALPVQAKPSPASEQSADRWGAERERMRKHKKEPASAATPKPKRFEYTDEDASNPLY